MSNDQDYLVTHEFSLVKFTKKNAYPVSTKDWDFIKKKLNEITDQTNPYQFVGSLCLGAALSTLVAILIGAFDPEQGEASSASLVVAIACTVTLATIGGGALFFARNQRKVKETMAKDIVEYMENIEADFSSEDEEETD